MRILHCLAPAAHGGLERVVQMLASAQAEAGHDVVVAGAIAPTGLHRILSALRRPLPVRLRSRPHAALARAVQETLARPDATRERVVAARARLETEFAVPAWLDRHERVYERSIGGDAR